MCWIKVNGILGLVLGWLALLPIPCQGAEMLESLQAVYERSLKKIETEHAEEALARPARYRAMLEAGLRACQQQGDLNGVLAMQAEQKRFAGSGAVPGAADAKTPPTVARVQTEWRDRNAQADLARHRAIADLADQYTARLEALKRERTVQGRFEVAVAAQKEIERLRNSPAVTAAQFALALAERETVAPEPEPEPVPSAPAPPSAPVVRPPDACPGCEGSGRAVNDCPSCGGTGQCRNCNGTGQRRSGIRGRSGTVGCVTCRMTGKCRECEGTGKRPGPCPQCKGSGRLGP